MPTRPPPDAFRDALTALLQWVAERDPAAAASALAEWDDALASERSERPGNGSEAPASKERPPMLPLRGCPGC